MPEINRWTVRIILVAVVAWVFPTHSPGQTVRSAPQAQSPATSRVKPVAASREEPAMAEKSGISAAALSRFGMKMTSGLAAKRKHENVFISPLSLFMALAMTENGAAGSTRAAMREALNVPANVSEEHLHESASALLKTLHAQKGIDLSIASALWSDRSLPLAPGFVRRCNQLYEAEAAVLNFKDPAAAATINAWVKRKTRDKIPGIVTPADVTGSDVILTNAVYFRGAWRYVFDKSQTQQQAFHLVNGQEKQVAMMHRSSIKEGYIGGNGYEAAALPYKDSEVLLYAILPAVGKSPEETLAGVSVEALRAASESNDLDIRLPRFTLDFSASLKDQLIQAGMGIAFKPGAGFAPMGSSRLFIGDVLHKTRLEVDEEGTIAAAATAVTMARSAAPRPVTKKTLVFDRPFALLLVDGQTGAVLFAGVVYDPASE
jgi:serine protease inhibitor